MSGLRAVGVDGRSFTLRRMGALERLRLFKAAGAELAGNDAWLGLAYLACAVTAIDDVPIPPPVNEAQIEAMVTRLGDGGIDAVAAALAADEAERPKAVPGNSAGTPI